MSTKIQNNQNVPASLDVKDEKGKVIAALPDGASVVFTSSAETVAQFRQGAKAADGSWTDDPKSLVGEITTDGDEIGFAVITGTVTWPDGKILSAAEEVEVVNSPPNSASFTVGTPEPDTQPAPTA